MHRDARVSIDFMVGLTTFTPPTREINHIVAANQPDTQHSQRLTLGALHQTVHLLLTNTIFGLYRDAIGVEETGKEDSWIHEEASCSNRFWAS